MGFIKAFSGALSGTFADQWKDFYVPRADLTASTAFIPAVPQAQNNGRGENYKGNENIITNGSKFVVTKDMALVTVQDGRVTGVIAEEGGFEFRSDDPNSQSIFAGDGLLSSTIKSAWEKTKFGGQPGSQQLAFYVNTNVQGIKYGLGKVFWKDSFLETMATAGANGGYNLIINPVLFVNNFVTPNYLQANSPKMDFNDLDDELGNVLLDQFTTSLTSALVRASVEAKGSELDTIQYIQINQGKFTEIMAAALEETYSWKENCGLQVDKVTIKLSYDETTQKIFEQAQADDTELRKDSRRGQKYSENMTGMMAAATGQAMMNAASNPNGAFMGMMGMNMAQQTGANVLGTVSNMQPQQPVQAAPVQAAAPAPAPAAEDPMVVLSERKKLLDAGLITQEDYDALKAKLLGL